MTNTRIIAPWKICDFIHISLPFPEEAYKHFELPIRQTSKPSFSDVPAGSAFYSYIETAAANGLLSGYSDGTFRPNETATRGQVSKIISSSVNLEANSPSE